MKVTRARNLVRAPKDGEKLYLVVSPTRLVLDNDNNWKGSTGVITVEVWLQKGDEDPTQSGMSDYRVNVYKNGTSTVKVTKGNTSSFTFEASKSDTSYEVELKVNGNKADSKTVSIENEVIGYGTLLTLIRNNLYTDDTWATYGTIGTTRKYDKIDGVDGDLTICRVGDYFTVTGSSSDTGCHHTITCKCTAVTASRIRGTCVSYTKDGDKGTGISTTTWYYLATTMATGVTRSTSGWTTTYQQGTPDLPYVWRYGDTLLTDGNHQYTDCELIFSYSAGANPNLLEQTNFSSLLALDKWTNRGHLEPIAGIVPVESNVRIETGIHAHNAYYDSTTKTDSQIQYKEILKQCLWNTSGTIRKLEPSTWYTLSFWAKGSGITTFIYSSDGSSHVFDRESVSYIDGVMQAANTINNDGRVQWSLSGTWKRCVFTFKTKSTIASADKNLLFRMYPKSTSALNSVYICMPKLEVGMQATSYLSNEESTHFGQLRNRRWALNTQYQAGGVDEQYDDTVLFGESGFHHCIKSHISTLDNAPNGTNGSIYWEATSKVAVLATDIFFAEKALINNLIATLIQTGYSGTPHIEAEGSEFKIFGKGQYPAIYLAVNSDNKAVLRFQNENTGEFLYDLGPDGIMKEFSEVADSYTPMKLKKLTNATRVSELLNITDSVCTTYYRFNEGYKQIGSGNEITKEYHISESTIPSSKNAQFFTSQNYNGTTIANGWYVEPNNGTYITIPGTENIFSVNIYEFSGGKLARSVTVYFSQTDNYYATHSVGCDEHGNELSTSTYQYLYSYADSQLTP
jgi:hypothetical protein